MKTSEHPIAIIGRGATLPGACSPEAFHQNLMRGRCWIREIPEHLWEQDVYFMDTGDHHFSSHANIAALVRDPEFQYADLRIPPAVVEHMSRAQKLALHCATQALNESGLTQQRGPWRERCAVMVAAIAGGDQAEALSEAVLHERFWSRMAKLEGEEAAGTLREKYEGRYSGYRLTEDTLPGASPNLVAGRIASAFHLNGINLTIDAACASSLSAISCGVRSLQCGESDLVIAGGVDTWVDVGAFIQFSRITALSREGCFPFDERASGLVIGEGCGLVVLKREQDALRDGDKIYARILGVGGSSDGAGRGITVPDSAGQLIALERAYEDAGVDPARLDYVECHGTGTHVGDQTELESISRLLKQHASSRSRDLPVGSVKGSVGHLRTAAGMAGLFNGIESLRQGWVPPQVHFHQKTSRFPWEGSGLDVAEHPIELDRDAAYVGVSGFGFGGTNSHVVLTNPRQEQAAPVQVPVQEFMLPPKVPLNGETAFLFPGQGAQFPGMVRDLAERENGKKLLQTAEEVVRELTGESLASYMYPEGSDKNHDERLRRTEIAQPAILSASVLLADFLKESGVVPHMLIGHSVGEYSALVTGGVISFEDAVRAVTRRGMLMSDSQGESSILAYVLGDPEDLQRFLSDAGPKIYCANVNSFAQVVIAGTLDAVQNAIESAREIGLKAECLNVDRAFHSPFVSHAVEPMREVLKSVKVSPGTIPMPANISRKRYPLHGEDDGPAKVIDLLCRQIDHQVDFVSQIEWAYACGIRRFVDVGPRRILQGLVDNILQGHEFQVLSADNGRNECEETIRGLPEALRRPLQFHRQPLRLNAPKHIMVKEEALEGLPPREIIRAAVARVSGYRKEEISDDAEFELDLGLGSLKMIEIISLLRGSVLSEGVRSFRDLTSVNKILFAAENSEKSLGKDEFVCWENAILPLSAVSHGSHQVSSDWHCSVLGDGPLPPGNWSPEPTSNHLSVLYAESLADFSSEQLRGLFAELKSLVQRGGKQWTIWSISRDEELRDAVFRSVSGFMKSVQLECPDLVVNYLDLKNLPATIEGSEDFLKIIGIGLRQQAYEQFSQPTLAELTLPEPDPALLASVFTADDTILVTGGARGIAAAVVKQWLPRTAARFILLGRRAETEEWMESAGPGRVALLQADLTKDDDVERLDISGVTWIWHAAGMTTLTPLKDRSEEEFQQVVDVKAQGLLRLLEKLDEKKIKGMVHFSSIVAHFGNMAQADYAAANGFLDGLRWKGIPQLSIGWTAWDEIGMASRGITRTVVESSGIAFLPLNEGLRFFDQCVQWWAQNEFVSTTLEVFARPHVDADEDPQDGSLCWVHPEGSAPPVFMICGIFGYSYRLQLVADIADSEVPFGILQPPNMDWTTVGVTTFEEMATWYADRIEGARPEGPLALLGTSFGGNMAFEVALLLQARGRTVERLMMVDTMPPEEDPLEHESLFNVLNRFQAEATDLIEQTGADMAEAQLQAFIGYQSNGKFQGDLDYFLMIGNGWPGAEDRRIFWTNHVSGEMNIYPVHEVHGQFSKHPARREIADAVSPLMVVGSAENAQLASRYLSTLVHDAPDGSLEYGPAKKARLIARERYSSRFWLMGESETPVWVLGRGKPLHKIEPVDGKFKGVVDVYALTPEIGESFAVVCREGSSWVEVGKVVWPIEKDPALEMNVFRKNPVRVLMDALRKK